MTLPIAELQSENPSAIIELFELQLVQEIHGSTEVYRFHSGANAYDNSDIIWNSLSYMALPVEADGFSYNGNGQLPRPKIKISNIVGVVTIILDTTPLEGAKLTRIRTLARYIDAVNFPPNNVNPYGTPDPAMELPREIYFVDRKVAENRLFVEFELVSSLDLAGVRGPKRQCISNICQWRYRVPNESGTGFNYQRATCPYNGSLYFDENDNPTTLANDSCGGRLTSCELRFGEGNELKYGSFPGIGTYLT